jgi:hypothetical protein
LLGTVPATCALVAAVVVALPASAAQAALVSVSACDNSALSQPFSPWADFSSYKLAPGGDFEGSLAGWSVQGDAQQVGASEPYGVTGSVGSSSLSLSRGAVATSPPTCVNAAYPTFRFFARTDTPGSTVAVTVVYNGWFGSVTIPVGVVALSGDWQPTLPMTTLSAVSGALMGGATNVQLRFTALTGTSQIDDVFVDPWHRG